jgi:hypothetical protein
MSCGTSYNTKAGYLASYLSDFCPYGEVQNGVTCRTYSRNFHKKCNYPSVVREAFYKLRMGHLDGAETPSALTLEYSI